jgi:signal transduction histidine kinase
LSISNTGSELAAADVEHVFDSFWRRDESRTGTGEHFGIGLAVVRKPAKALGIRVKARSEQQGVFTISLELPPA